MAIYREQTREQKLTRRRIRDVLLWVLVILVIVCIIGARVVLGGFKDQGTLSIKTTILNAANQCYAIEGAYPPSLDYLKDHYGVRVNENDYVITYVVFASNVQPTVTVVAK